MHNSEQQFDRFIPSPETKMQVVAVLEDVGGNHYFAKTEAGQYLYLDQTTGEWEEANEDTAASAILKHGYKPIIDGPSFEFKNRSSISI
jgi:hypothetical protein